MNSRERRKMEAEQHNYALWLYNHTRFQRIEPKSKAKQRRDNIIISSTMAIAASTLVEMNDKMKPVYK